MTLITMAQTTQNARIIKATPEAVYQAFTDPKALETWQAPGDMTAKVHNLDLRVGGGYEMSLYYPDDEQEMEGKTTGNEDRFTARFVELIPNEKIVQVVNFQSPDPDFSGEMTVEITFAPKAGGTEVTYLFKDIPKGIKPEQNESGTRSSLENLARYVE